MNTDSTPAPDALDDPDEMGAEQVRHRLARMLASGALEAAHVVCSRSQKDDASEESAADAAGE